ncbi:unnamed protein product [Adineta steineri]|uniref:Nucleoside transporter/FeoB GTPase Gate domain-containing protein n=1 Tax=Adineta steineri TaxID=433720 RepID=A0A815Q7I5_9BILA|nr:unnamed protein product [Adineta steineri]
MTKNRIGRENPIFELDQQPYIINTTNGLILTSKLQSMEKEEDKNNVGFEKLPEDDHSNCLFVLKLRTYLIQIIQKQKVTSIIIFLGAVINVLYYLGVMQYVIGKIAWFMQKTLNTTAAESRNAAASIFVGISEAPLMIMLLVSKMTTSELHSVLVDGFATMAGFEMKFF